MKKTFALSLIAVAALAGAGCSSEASSTTPIDGAGKAKIVFAADFANGEGCTTHKGFGCDVYTADIGFDGSVENVLQRTSEDRIEAFPVFSTDGKTVYANRYGGKNGGDIEYVSLADGSIGILQTGALGPAVLPDGKTLVYVRASDSNVASASFVTATSLGDAKILTTDGDYHEPHASSTGAVLFEKLSGAGRGSNTAQARALISSAGKMIDLTEADGTGHCFWNASGTKAMCNNSEKYRGIFAVPFDGEAAGSGSLFLSHPTVKQISGIDSDYESCLGVSYAYGTFCDDEHMIVSIGCATDTPTGRDTLMSKLGLIDLSTSPPTVYPLGKNLADAFGGPGISSNTVSCRME